MLTGVSHSTSRRSDVAVPVKWMDHQRCDEPSRGTEKKYDKGMFCAQEMVILWVGEGLLPLWWWPFSSFLFGIFTLGKMK